MDVCLCLWGVHIEARGIKFSWVRVICGCELMDMSAGNQTPSLLLKKYS